MRKKGDVNFWLDSKAYNVVENTHVTIVGESEHGMWVTGLAKTVALITVGQKYVLAGEIIDPVFEGKTNE